MPQFSTLRTIAAAIVPALLVLLSSPDPAGARDPEPIRLAQDPGLAPDGSSIVFSWGDDLWTVPSEGGTARRLTVHPGLDAEPAFSPDGQTIAFISGGDLWVMDTVLKEPVRVTRTPEEERSPVFSPDGDSILAPRRSSNSSKPSPERRTNRNPSFTRPANAAELLSRGVPPITDAR